MSNEKEKFKLTKLEKNWILYDVANSAFVLLVTTLIPIYFNILGVRGHLSNTTYLAYWGYAQSVATIISALAGPVIGAAADRKGRKRKIFLVTIAVGTAGCLLFGLARQWLIFLIIFVLARVAFNLSLVIYDSRDSKAGGGEMKDGGGFAVEMTSGAKYRIEASVSGKAAEYTFSIGKPEISEDITGRYIICGATAYSGQKKSYMFKA
jgi:UMF1 family MFS transporter